MSKENDIFNEDNEVKSNFMSWGKPGNYVLGTLSSKRRVENQLSDKKEMQTIYEIKAKEGVFNSLEQDENGNYVPVKESTVIKDGEFYSIGGKKGIDAQMRNVKIGQVVGIKFKEIIPAKEKGRYPTKLIKIFTTGTMDNDFLAGMEEEVGDDEKAEEAFDKFGKD